MKRCILVAIFLLLVLAQLCHAIPTTQPSFGLVVSPDDKPVAGAKVFGTFNDDEQPHIVETTTTDAAGRFHLPATTRPVRLIVQASGFGLSSAASYPSPEEAEQSPSKLSAATILHIQFVDPEGKLASGLKVAPELTISGRGYGGFIRVPQELRDAFTQTTDANGVCAFEGMPADSQVRLSVLDDRFAQLNVSSNIHLSDAAVSEGGVIHLKHACTISGHITFGDSHQPVVGLRVGAQGVDGISSSAGGSAVSNAQGNYQIKQMTGGDFNVALDLKNDLGNQYTAAAHERVKLTDGQQLAGIDFELIHGGLIRGKVSVKGTDRPVGGLEIGVYGPAHPKSSAWVQTTQTKSDGSYELRVPPGDQYVYFLSSPPAGLAAPHPNSANIDVAADETTELNFQFTEQPTNKITGNAVDADGKPIAGATILLARPGNGPIGGSEATQSDSNGDFVFEDAPAKSILRARAKKLATAETTVVGRSHEPITLTLRPDATASVRVSVIKGDRSPMPNAKVQLIQWGDRFGGGVEAKSTGDDGTCIFKDLYLDERYSIDISASGYGHVSKVLTLTAGQQVSLDPIILPEANSFISGTVVDDDGKPVADVEVGFNSSASGPQAAKTDAQGHFKITNLVNSDDGLLFVRGSKLSTTKRATAGQENVEIKFEADPAKQ